MYSVVGRKSYTCIGLYDLKIYLFCESPISTQPRRVAAVTVAQRVASERGSPIGGEVGSVLSAVTVLPC